MANLSNLSAYVTAHTRGAGQPAYGYTITGYVKEGKKTTYCDIWVPADRVPRKKKEADGTITLSINFAEVTVKAHPLQEQKDNKGSNADNDIDF